MVTLFRAGWVDMAKIRLKWRDGLLAVAGSFALEIADTPHL